MYIKQGWNIYGFINFGFNSKKNIDYSFGFLKTEINVSSSFLQKK